MKNIISVNTGDVKVGRKGEMLVSSAIGSCIVVLAYDLKKKIAGMAHIMLPGKAPEKSGQKNTRYAYNAINMLSKKMALAEAKKRNIKVCVFGGGNVLKRKDDNICKANIKSVFALLAEKKMSIFKKAVGGTERRTLCFDVETGFLQYTVGDSKKIFCKCR